MNYGITLFLGALLAMAGSWGAFVLTPYLQLGGQQPAEVPGSGDEYPVAPPGMAQRGEQVYRENGCVYCHTQQLRPVEADLARWGSGRRTVARDYLFAETVQLGSKRIGPDLANVGNLRPDPDWHYRHLFAPDSVVEGSTMPPYRYLFRKQKVVGDPSPEALDLEGGPAPEEGYKIVPTDKAEALVAYLLSLQVDTPLFEAPIPEEGEEEEQEGEGGADEEEGDGEEIDPEMFQ